MIRTLPNTGILQVTSMGNVAPLLLDRVIKAWKKFRTISQTEKDRYKLPQFECDFADPGYIRKCEEGVYDKKEFFHFTPNIRSLYGMLGICDFAPEFSELLDHLTQFARMMDFQVIHGSEPYLGYGDHNVEFFELLSRGSGITTYRLLGYDPCPIENVIASSHIDKCGMTYAVYSSHPGLQVDVGQDPNSRVWEDVIAPEGKMIVFGGHQLWVWSNGKIKPVVHQVVSRTEKSRDSMVVFKPFLGVERIPRHIQAKALMPQYGF